MLDKSLENVQFLNNSFIFVFVEIHYFPMYPTGRALSSDWF